MNSIKELIKLNTKNILGWRTKRKIVVFGVDDYGNVRVHSKGARERMNRAGLKIESRFDQFDSLENEEDLQMLFETLNSVKDKNGNPAIFTALSIPANIDFEKMEASGNKEYFYETLPETFCKLKGYENVWSLWQEGIVKKLIFPQFHGREHLNLKLFRENLLHKDDFTLIALANRSYTSISRNPYPNIGYTAAFQFDQIDENIELVRIIEDGLNIFEEVFGFRSVSFNAPGGSEHHMVHSTLSKNGVKYIETPLLKREHQGNNKIRTILNYTGKRNEYDQIFMVRNCVFEPTEPKSFDWIGRCLLQIETAFKWHRPAIISSHRVNYGGHIDPKNRKKGISDLKALLKGIAAKWPDVEFMTTAELGGLINSK